MRLPGRVLRLVVASMVVAWAASAAWAVTARRRFVPRGTPESDEIAIGAYYDELQFESRAGSFRGGTIECGFGGGVVDLSGATLDPSGARLRVTAVFGGGQILVPPSWRVEIHGRALFGGIADARPVAQRPAVGPALVIDAVLFFGGFALQAAGRHGEPAVPQGEPVPA